MKVLSNKVIRDVHLYLENMQFGRNQVVFYEGQKPEFVLFVKSGSYEITKSFKKDSHVSHKSKTGPLLKVTEKDEQFIISKMINQNSDSNANNRKMINATEYFRKKAVLPREGAGFKE